MRGPPRFRACGRGREAGTASDVHGRARYPRGADDWKAPRGAFCFWWALRPIFVWRGAASASGGETIVTGTLRERLIALIEPLLQRLGYELVELEYSAGRAHAVVRLFIDREAGVTLDDCAQVSREVSTLLDVEDPIPSAYTLEVSSPGFDRVLRTQAHFGRFVGSRVFVELKEPRAGRRRYTGRLLTVDEAGIALEVDREQVTVSFAEIGKARLAS
jgi:ribosome maturation factor RimP